MDYVFIKILITCFPFQGCEKSYLDLWTDRFWFNKYFTRRAYNFYTIIIDWQALNREKYIFVVMVIFRHGPLSI